MDLKGLRDGSLETASRGTTRATRNLLTLPTLLTLLTLLLDGSLDIVLTRLLGVDYLHGEGAAGDAKDRDIAKEFGKLT